MVIVRYLVEEKGVDVNQMDVPEGEQRPNNWGVPMAYAVPAQNTEGDGGEGVVRWLLEVRLIFLSWISLPSTALPPPKSVIRLVRFPIEVPSHDD